MTDKELMREITTRLGGEYSPLFNRVTFGNDSEVTAHSVPSGKLRVKMYERDKRYRKQPVYFLTVFYHKSIDETCTRVNAFINEANQ
jgi:hypothetical protein